MKHSIPKHEDDLLSTSGTARELACSEKTVRALEARGELHALRASNGYRIFRRGDVDALKRRQAQDVS